VRTERRWDPCVSHRAQQAAQFVTDFFKDAKRRILLVAGAGFDPRATNACQILSAVAGQEITAALVREERPSPHAELVRRAEANLNQMRSQVNASQELAIQVFASDGAVVGGRTATNAMRHFNSSEYTDIIIDLSALSVGIAYPLVRYFFQILQREAKPANLHLLVTDEPMIDSAISAVASDRVGTVHGFQGGFGLDKNARSVKLWLPQLVRGKRAVLEKLHSYVDPHEVCPILPFPAIHPRFADELIDEYRQEFESAWEVDARNLLYAEQRNPLDLYRTVLRIDDARRRVFAEVGGSLLVLSPLGSKAMSAGALMAAIERDFPVAHVEAIGYNVDFERLKALPADDQELIHVWLTGEAYAKNPNTTGHP
jgi:hypothetical protein